MPSEDIRTPYPVNDDDWTVPDDEREYGFAARDEDGVPFSIPRD